MKQKLNHDHFLGLKPKALLLVGRGVSREEVKASLLATGRVVGQGAVLSVEDLCVELLGIEASAVLGFLGRKERLVHALRNPVFRGRLPGLMRLKRGKGFFRKLDRTLQAGRMAFTHEEEARVFEERLSERESGENPLRVELRAFAALYEALLEDQNAYDLPRLLKEATLVAKRFQEKHSSVQRIVFYGAQSLSNAERAFLEALPVDVEFETPQEEGSPQAEWDWVQYQSLDDAAIAFAQTIHQEDSKTPLQQTVILIPDDPSVRGTLLRVFKRFKIPLLDPRDPTELIRDERIRVLLLPLRIVALGGRREDLLSWARVKRELQSTWVQGIQESGMLRADRYAPDSVAEAYRELKQIFGGRKTFAELSVALRTFWKESLEPLEPFLEQFETQIERPERKLPVRMWFEAIQEELPSMKPPAPPLKPEDGWVLHVVGQRVAPWTSVKRLVLFGWSEGVMERGASGDWWWSERERDLLAEFGVLGSQSHRQDRVSVMREWVHRVERVEVWDALYAFDGKERTSLASTLWTLGLSADVEKPRFLGGNPKFLKSRLPSKESRDREVRLPMPRELQVAASGLDEYAKCGFIGLVRLLWKLEDVKESGWDLWPEARGILLHRAAELLARSWDVQKQKFQKTPEEILDLLLGKDAYRGVFAIPRVRAQVRARLLKTLMRFYEDEVAYLKRSGSRYFALEKTEAESLVVEDVTIRGRIDRVDETQDGEGLFVIDYKTSSRTPPSAEDIIRDGKSVQLGVYAHALMRSTGRKVVGVQYIQLTPNGGRSRGIFPMDRNGKKGSVHVLTEVRSNNKSLVSFDEVDVWGEVLARIQERVRELKSGIFDARPRVESECVSCRLRDVCGESRRVRE